MIYLLLFILFAIFGVVLDYNEREHPLSTTLAAILGALLFGMTLVLVIVQRNI